MKQVVVVIPVHKEIPTSQELASLKQCYKVLGNHTIKMVAPEGLNLIHYKSVISELEVVSVDRSWLANIKQYNRLKKSRYFYNLFKDFEYLLTYELDAWVFRDELIYWCNKNFDFIGAPQFSQDFKIPGNINLSIGQNSGFSLRNIPKSLLVLNKLKTILKWRKFWYRSRLQSIVRFEQSTTGRLFNIKVTKDFKGLWGGIHYNEDAFWTRYVAATFPDFKLAPPQTSLEFSFEVMPSYLYSLNEERLPFGCHAWFKYEPEFWENFIKN